MKEQAKLIHREIGWLSFNERVLQEAQDMTVPLIERIRFLGIFSNNLDEFFKVRVATVKRMIDLEEGDKLFEGEKPKKLMNQIQKKVIQLQNKFEYTFQQIQGELEKNQIFIINELELNPSQESFVKEYFYDYVMPVISPVLRCPPIAPSAPPLSLPGREGMLVPGTAPRRTLSATPCLLC